MILIDNRTEVERETHTRLIGGRDSFMSGWGPCAGGSSFAYWACQPEELEAVTDWVEGRGEIRLIDIETVLGTEATTTADHLHIYAVRGSHRALRGRT